MISVVSRLARPAIAAVALFAFLFAWNDFFLPLLYTSDNPDNWPLSDLRAMMHRHLRLTAREAVAELSGNYTGSVRAYDRVEREILGMADMLSTGIIKQFPHRFG